MRVSLLNLNLVANDAIGTGIINQVRFFKRRGDSVQVFVEHAPQNVPSDIAALVKVAGVADLAYGRSEHFDRSDLFIYHYPGHYELVSTIRRVNRGSVVFHYHNVTPPDLWRSGYQREDLQRGVAEVALVHHADWAIADSPFNRDDLVRRFGYDPSRVFLLPFAVDLSCFHPSTDHTRFISRWGLRERRVLLFVGRMAGNKRIDTLIEALPLIKAKVPQAVLVLVGDEKGNPALRAMTEQARTRAAELGVAKDVIFTGMIDHEKIPYPIADVYVSASLHEGFGVPLIEAMACGVPVVVSRATAHPWVVDDAGLLCEPDHPQDMAEKVIQVLLDNHLRDDLRQRGLVRAQMFSLANYEATLGQIVTTIENDLNTFGPSYKRMRAGEHPPSADMTRLLAEIRELYAQSDIMLRDYTVHSRLPVIGSLIAWVRRNLTSHLREPYLDPMLERQVKFNRRMLALIEEAIHSQADHAGAVSGPTSNFEDHAR